MDCWGRMAKIFFSYSHNDESLRDELEKHLASLKHRGLVESWHDRRINAGDEWEPQISAHLQSADVILLLISSDFIASRYCYDLEMAEALRKHKSREARVIPIILRPCDWHDLPFGKLQAATRDGRPVTKFPSLDDGFLEVVQSIKSVLLERSQITGAVQAEQMVAQTVEVTGLTEVRSSNLGVRRQFSDRDRDGFVIDCFEYIAAYFENSLSELSLRNPEIEYQFRPRDSNAFEAVLYFGGRQASKCGIWLDAGALRNGIAYSYGGLGLGNSFNESLSVVDDGHCLGLRPLGMALYLDGGREAMLTPEGAAESFWGLFIKPLQ